MIWEPIESFAWAVDIGCMNTERDFDGWISFFRGSEDSEGNRMVMCTHIVWILERKEKRETQDVDSHPVATWLFLVAYDVAPYQPIKSDWVQRVQWKHSSSKDHGEINDETDKDDKKGQAAKYNDHITAVERPYLQQWEKIDLQRLTKMASKSHRDQIQEFNQYLANLSEHYDIPKVGPG
ncbi:hypothetical protein GH714_008375 [Hevea brasiliensis]|uniref:Uncharacterized protein n=1 Tax=Hevea brasiliensis TaxID=3981 RepID=A0A6A6LRW6_HEVBR|nr:hypothetical protein GH714_008375 [Hevea brasiliensis]